MSIQDETGIDTRGNRDTRHGTQGNGHRSPTLAASLSPLLKQYEEMLIEHVESKVKEETLAALEEESRALRYQLQERLSSVESEVQRRVQTFLSSTRDQMSHRIGEEIDGVLDSWTTRLRNSLVMATPDPQDAHRNMHPPASETGQSDEHAKHLA